MQLLSIETQEEAKFVAAFMESVGNFYLLRPENCINLQKFNQDPVAQLHR
jgi:hypothetical protein